MRGKNDEKERKYFLVKALEDASRNNRLACSASDGVFRPRPAQPLNATGDWTSGLLACGDRLLGVLKELSMYVSRGVFGLARTSRLQSTKADSLGGFAVFP